MRHGFSLIELMVVVAIAGIGTALAVPAMSSAIRRAKEPTEVVRLRTFLTESRNMARRSNRCVLVERADERTFTRTVLTTCDAAVAKHCTCAASLVPLATTTTLVLGTAASVTGISNTAPAMSGLATATGTDRLLYFANGSTPYLDAPVVSIALRESKKTRTLSVMPASGIVRSDGGL